MKKDKLMRAIFYLLALNLLLVFFVCRINRGILLVDIESETTGAAASVYYAPDGAFNENHRTDTKMVGRETILTYTLASVGIRQRPDFRLDFADLPGHYTLRSVTYASNPILSWTLEGGMAQWVGSSVMQNQLTVTGGVGLEMEISTVGEDPYLVIGADTLSPRLNPVGLAMTLLLEVLMLIAIWGAVSLSGEAEIPPHRVGQRLWLDLAKLFCAYLIVALHVGPLSTLNETANYYITQGVARLSVPLFFAISGYLFFQRLYHPESGKFEKNSGAMMSYCGRILTLYFFWNLVYAFIVPSGGAVMSVRSYLWNLLFEGGYWQLWYLLALVIGVVVLYWLLCAGMPMRWLMGLAGVLYLFGMVLDFGYLQLVKTVQPLGVLFTLVLLPAEALFAKDRFADGPTNLWLTLPAVVFFLMAALTQGTDLSIPVSVARRMRTMSTGIYLIHPFFIEWMERIPFLVSHHFILYLCVCGCATGFSLLLIALSRPMPLLKKIY